MAKFIQTSPNEKLRINRANKEWRRSKLPNSSLLTTKAALEGTRTNQELETEDVEKAKPAAIDTGYGLTTR
jgi:hypothetical protein